MTKATNILRRSAEAIKDPDLLKVLCSEINHELTSNRFRNCHQGSLGDFSIESDLPQSQDIILQKKCQSGEEIAISALLGPESGQDTELKWDLQMKVCIKKSGLSSVLQFDCGVWRRNNSSSDFSIHGAYYLPPRASLSPSDYRGPIFSSLDPEFQHALKRYLEDKGIEGNLMNFLLLHLHKKEQDQYMEWLMKIKDLVEGE